jgi:hypothetical protein
MACSKTKLKCNDDKASPFSEHSEQETLQIIIDYMDFSTVLI